MRLIDADKLIEKLRDFKEWENDDGRPIHTMSEIQRIDRCINFAQTEPTAFDVQTKEIKWISVEDRLPDDGDSRFYMCLVENHLEDPPMSCQYEEERGFGFWNDIYDPVTLGFVDSEFQTMEELHYEKVRYWMPLIEPPEDEEEEDERYEIN